MASSNPENHPAANSGLSEEIGATTKAKSAERILPLAIITPIAAKVPLINIHDFIWFKPIEASNLKHNNMASTMIIGISQPRAFLNGDFFLIVSNWEIS